jgi:hypothetical protein
MMKKWLGKPLSATVWYAPMPPALSQCCFAEMPLRPMMLSPFHWVNWKPVAQICGGVSHGLKTDALDRRTY